jgi:Protein NO VEIN, C-terminal
MASDYKAILAENKLRYGTEIGRIGQLLLAERYSDRTQFIFELLQNAEDVFARQSDRGGSRAVEFNLSTEELRFTHRGEPFDQRDVQGICGIAETTKDLTSIGRFGIGFKSVYAYTDNPMVHSGDNDFVIRNYVLPSAIDPIDRKSDETVFIIPLSEKVANAKTEIANGMRQLGPRTLLFLRQIEEITWNVEGGPSGLYLRSKPEVKGPNVREITVIGQQEGESDIEETWMVFSRDVSSNNTHMGQVEIAFSISQSSDPCSRSVQATGKSHLVAYFPTIIETHLGFLVQGPFRTTPSRDNVPRNDPWNKYLINETASLLVEALHWLRNNDLLDIATLQCLPIDRENFDQNSMFAPFFEATRTALSTETLLPSFDGHHISANNALLSRTKDLRELFSTNQLTSIFGPNDEFAWLSDEITQDRTPKLRQYLIRELHISEIAPEAVLAELSQSFLEAQPDSWILSLYEFLKGKTALGRRLNNVPLVRLEEGNHVAAHQGGQPCAFLPSEIQTDFPTVRSSVSSTNDARSFLESLGLSAPNLVDDVIRNILPKFAVGKVKKIANEYETLIHRILTASETDSKTHFNRLISELSKCAFVIAIDSGSGSKQLAKPNDLYIATERLKELFNGVPGVLFVDDNQKCLRGQNVLKLLQICGASRYLKPEKIYPSFSQRELQRMRNSVGHEASSGVNDRIFDWTIVGAEYLLASFKGSSAQTALGKARLLWEALCDVEEQQGQLFFLGSYSWTHYGTYSCDFAASFVRQLINSTWIPDQKGKLQRPDCVLFDSLNWKPNPFLVSIIGFKPPVIEALAKEAGIDPGVLDLLKSLGLTDEADLRQRLGIEDAPINTEGGESIPDRKPAKNSSVPNIDESGKYLGRPKSSSQSASNRKQVLKNSSTGHDMKNPSSGRCRSQGGTSTSAPGTNNKNQAKGSRPFISFVGAHPNEAENDPDSLSHKARMAIEEKALEIILSHEPQLQRTGTNNPGYDLFEIGEGGEVIRFVEVKAMTGGLNERPVALSRAQFRCADEQGERFWLYIVEYTNDSRKTQILPIQDPAGLSQRFTFDHGWREIVQIQDST